MAFPNLTVGPQSELDAVNRMLFSIGARPVNSLEGVLPVDASLARQVLHDSSREIQSEGFSFNREFRYPLAKDENDRFPLPATALWVDPTHDHRDFVERTDNGTRFLYDREEHTFEMPTVASPLKVDVIFFLAFEELPEPARQYIAAVAGRRFQQGRVQDDTLFRFTANDELEAQRKLSKFERRTRDRNWFRSGARTSRIVRRRVGVLPPQF